jgi:mannose-1-phosphate guanylyltransferase
MRAILLAAGFGTRLPLTNTMPKCLVPIHGQPLLGIWLERLTQAGIGPFLVNTHYLADQVEQFIAASPYRDQVTLVHESTLLGTAGTLMANLDFFQGEDGLLIHADNYCLADFREFMEAHRQRPPAVAFWSWTIKGWWWGSTRKWLTRRGIWPVARFIYCPPSL